MRIKKDDKVVVLSGKDRGVEGQVIAVDQESGKITVAGVNEVKRHVKPSQRNMQGGRLSKNMPIPVGKVMLICPTCGKRTRVGYKYDESAVGADKRRSKARVCKKCGAVIPEPTYKKSR